MTEFAPGAMVSVCVGGFCSRWKRGGKRLMALQSRSSVIGACQLERTLLNK